MQGRTTRDFYLIGVVAEELAMHPQTLRKYEQAGFLAPRRMGALRMYSREDLERLRIVKHFVDDLGLNIAGVELALKLTAQILELRAQVSSGSERSEADKQTLDRLDAMLGGLGLQVSAEIPEPEAAPAPAELPAPRPPVFEFQPGQALRVGFERG
jgi:MerR family transcriptional regulator/heat shock protein HspR